MSVVLLAILLIVVAAALALAIPVDVRLVAVRTDGTVTTGAIDVEWLFGWLSFRAREPGEKDARASGSRGPGAPRARAIRTHRRRSWRPLLTPEFVSRAGGLVADLLAMARPRHLTLDARLGFDDPAETAMAYGLFIGPLAPALAHWASLLPRANLRVAPEFTGACAAGVASAEFRVVPARVLWRVMRFLCSPAVLRAVWQVVRSKSA